MVIFISDLASLRTCIHLKESLSDTEVDIIGDIAFCGQNITVLPSDKRRHIREERFSFSEIHEDGGCIAAEGDIGEADLQHQTAVGNLIKVPLLPAHHVPDTVSVISEYIPPCPACRKNSTVFVQQRSLFRIFFLQAWSVPGCPAAVCSFHRSSLPICIALFSEIVPYKTGRGQYPFASLVREISVVEAFFSAARCCVAP